MCWREPLRRVDVFTNYSRTVSTKPWATNKTSIPMRACRTLLRGASRRIDASNPEGSSGQAVAVVVGSLLVGVALYGGIYLPYYSEGSLEARERASASGMAAARRRAELQGDSAREKLEVERAPGSVWRNIAIKREGTSGEEGSSGWPSISREK